MTKQPANEDGSSSLAPGIRKQHNIYFRRLTCPEGTISTRDQDHFHPHRRHHQDNRAAAAAAAAAEAKAPFDCTINGQFSNNLRAQRETTSEVGTTKISCDIIIKSNQSKRPRVIVDTNATTEKEELVAYRGDDDRDGNHDGEPNVDAGYAWIILVVMFVINASTFGTARAYGLIFENSARRDEQGRSEAALPFTIMGAIENMAGPLTSYLLARCKSWRLMIFAGSCLVTVSHLLAASLESQLGQILSMGLMCGLGQSFISISSFQINNAYFVRYRSRAFGIGLTGAAVGTFYISPVCQFVLDNYTRSACYLMLGLILLPNVPLSLLLRPKRGRPAADSRPTSASRQPGTIPATPAAPNRRDPEDCQKLAPAAAATAAATTLAATTTTTTASTSDPSVYSISNQLAQIKARRRAREEKRGFWWKVVQVLSTPLFHLIWPTQLLFCWFNFVFGMIITDFGKDRGLDNAQVSHLIVIWASGQLFGRLCLGSLVDLRVLSYKSCTIVCFAAISLITCALNLIQPLEFGAGGANLATNLVSFLVFVLAMFISNLYLLFNGLVFHYMDKSLTALSIGISSFVGSFFLLPRAGVIGHYRDTFGNYDAMIEVFAYVSMVSALLWLIVPVLLSSYESRFGALTNRTNSTRELFITGSNDNTLVSDQFKINSKK